METRDIEHLNNLQRSCVISSNRGSCGVSKKLSARSVARRSDSLAGRSAGLYGGNVATTVFTGPVLMILPTTDACRGEQKMHVYGNGGGTGSKRCMCMVMQLVTDGACLPIPLPSNHTSVVLLPSTITGVLTTQPMAAIVVFSWESQLVSTYRVVLPCVLSGISIQVVHTHHD